MKIKQIFVFAMLLSSSVLCQSQDIKYVSYFPVPFALHEQLDIKTLSILGSRGGAQISAGSASNITGVFSVKDGFIAADSVYISSEQDSDPGIGDTPVNLTAGQAASTGSTPDYDSSVGAMGNIQITAFSGSALHSLEAYNNAVITGVKWGGRGGIGINAGNNINWPSQCSGFNLSWVDLKLQGSDHYRTYLTCGGSAGGGPGPGCTCSGGVLPGNYQSCGDGRQRLCQTDCTWGACSCPNPLVWNGTQCVSGGGGGATPVVKTADAKVTCDSSSCSTYTYDVCKDGTGSTGFPSGFNPDNCRARTTQPVCFNDFLRQGVDEFSCTEVSMPNCPSGSSNSAICSSKGVGYKCLLSATGSPNGDTACMCEWYNGGNSGGSYCDEDSGLSCVNVFFAGQGTATYLSCE